MEIDLIMAKNTQNISTEKQTERAAPDFNGAAIIDENGVLIHKSDGMKKWNNQNVVDLLNS